MIRVTIKQLAEKIDIDYNMCNQLVGFLEKKGFAKRVDVIKPVSGKGRGATVFEVPSEVSISLIN